MINDPEQQTQEPPEQIILPALPETTVPPRPAEMYPRMSKVSPGQLIRGQEPPQPPLIRLRSFWRKDPANKVLLVAVAVVLIAGIVLATLATRAFIFNPNLLSFSSTSSQNPGGATPAGTVDFRPTFPTPGGGVGSSNSSQPPDQQNTPSLQPTVTQQPNPSPQPGTLTVQITSIPGQVRNFSSVDVGVQTSEPNVTVYLSITYNVSPFRGYAGPRTTDGGGNATIPWTVYLFGGGERHATAVVIAIARDQNGQQAHSQTVTVQINGGGGGGL